MDEEMLRKILKEELEPIHADIKEMKTDIKDIKKTLQEVESINATRHTTLMNDISNIKKDLNDIKIVTSQNCFDIVKLNVLKSVK